MKYVITINNGTKFNHFLGIKKIRGKRYFLTAAREHAKRYCSVHRALRARRRLKRRYNGIPLCIEEIAA